jgi:ankyrin repeat protein
MGKRPPLVKVDVADSFGRTALHWACFLSMQNSADFLIGQGADPEARALPGLDAIWGSGMWDARPRSTTAGEGKKMLPTAEGVMIGPTPLELCHQLHGARVLVKGTVDIALDRRVEDDFVGASARSASFYIMFCLPLTNDGRSIAKGEQILHGVASNTQDKLPDMSCCRALAAEARVAKEVDRLKAEQGSEDLEDLKPDKDVYDIVHSTTRPVTEDMKAASQQQQQPAGDLEDLPQPEPPLSQEEAHKLQLARALRMASASANFGEVIELQAAGADVNAVEVASGLTALHLACHFGAVDVARSLIAGGANKAAVDKYGRTCKEAVPDESALVELFSD